MKNVSLRNCFPFLSEEDEEELDDLDEAVHGHSRGGCLITLVAGTSFAFLLLILLLTRFITLEVTNYGKETNHGF